MPKPKTPRLESIRNMANIDYGHYATVLYKFEAALLDVKFLLEELDKAHAACKNVVTACPEGHTDPSFVPVVNQCRKLLGKNKMR